MTCNERDEEENLKMIPKMLRNLALALMVLPALLFATAQGALADAIPESEDPIKLAINDWTGQHISTMIPGEILKRMGYNVEYVVAGVYPQFPAIRDGEIHVNMEVWSNNLGDILPQALEEGSAESLGDSGLKPAEGWSYPSFVEEMCPGLPDWRALNDCVDVFVTPETHPKGRIVGLPADWGVRSPLIIKALGLDYEAIPAGSEGALIAEMKAAQEAKSPLIIWFWTPHWIHSEIEVEWVQLPEYEPACTEDPSWGLNPDETWDCGLEPPGTLKIAWSGLRDQWPAAHRFLELFQLTNDVQMPLMKRVDVDGEKLEDVVADWVDRNQEVWMPWVEAAKGGG